MHIFSIEEQKRKKKYNFEIRSVVVKIVTKAKRISKGAANLQRLVPTIY